LGGWNDPDVRRLFRLLLPSLFGVAVYEINVIGLGIIGSFLPSGQIFHFNNATRLEELVMGLFTFAFTMAGLPTLSEHHAKGNWRKMGDTLRLTFSATFYIVLPAMAGLAVAGNAVVAMLYLHGAFGYADVLSTAGTLRVLVLGMPAVAAVRVMVPVFYAMGNARKPVIASTLTMLVTIALGWYLSGTYQVRGLAAGLALGTWFQCALLVIFLRPLAKKLAPWFSWSSMLRQMVAALVVAGGAYWVQGHGAWEQGGASLGNWGVLLATVGGGMVVYLGITLALREPEARNWLALVLRIVGRSASPASKSTSSKSTSSKSK
jgi:putative peptidoglycan lipid II flippase